MGICEHISNINNTNNNKINEKSNTNTNNNKINKNFNSYTNNNSIINNNKNSTAHNSNNTNNNTNKDIITNNNSNNKNNSNSKNNEIFDPKNNINNQLVITMEQKEKIIKQTKIYICKIQLNNGICGTGVLCKIPFPNKNNFLPVLITNHHVISKEKALKDKKIKIIFEMKFLKELYIVFKNMI